MPKVNLGFTPSRQADVIAKTIRRYMVDNDIPDLTTMAQRLSMSRQTFSRKLKQGGWDEAELATAIRVLKIRPEEVLAMFGLKLPQGAA